MMRTYPGHSLALLTLALMLGGSGMLSGCGGGGTPAGVIEPGRGVVMGGVSITLGETRDQLISSLGEAIVFRDLGPLGTHFRYDRANLSGLLDPVRGVSVIWLDDAFRGATGSGIGPGSSRAEVAAAFGASGEDPFLSASWCDGIVFIWQADRVVRVSVVPAAEGDRGLR